MHPIWWSRIRSCVGFGHHHSFLFRHLPGNSFLRRSLFSHRLFCWQLAVANRFPRDPSFSGCCFFGSSTALAWSLRLVYKVASSDGGTRAVNQKLRTVFRPSQPRRRRTIPTPSCPGCWIKVFRRLLSFDSPLEDNCAGFLGFARTVDRRAGDINQELGTVLDVRDPQWRTGTATPRFTGLGFRYLAGSLPFVWDTIFVPATAALPTLRFLPFFPEPICASMSAVVKPCFAINSWI